MPENQSTEPNPRIELLYVGCRENDRGKPLFHLWYDLTGIVNDGSPLEDEQARHQIYGSKKKGHTTKNITFASPGAIYSFEQSDNGVFGATGQYLGRWACEDDVLKWTAEHNAIDRAAELAERAKKENKQHLEWDALEPFRQAFLALALSHRIAVLSVEPVATSLASPLRATLSTASWWP
jgi:hypothetical protein